MRTFCILAVQEISDEEACMSFARWILFIMKYPMLQARPGPQHERLHVCWSPAPCRRLHPEYELPLRRPWHGQARLQKESRIVGYPFSWIAPTPAKHFLDR